MKLPFAATITTMATVMSLTATCDAFIPTFQVPVRRRTVTTNNGFGPENSPLASLYATPEVPSMAQT